MIGPSGTVQVMVATKPVDFRKGAEGLAAPVRGTMHTDPFSGVVCVFRAKLADRMKLIFWNGTVAKRLQDGRVQLAPGAGWGDAARRGAVASAARGAGPVADARAAADCGAGGVG